MTAPALEPQEADKLEFGIAIRGYDRRQVEDRIQALGNELAEARSACQQAEQRSAQTEDELRAAQDKLKQGGRRQEGNDSGEGFGFRVEKMLRMAEVEASDIRGKAAREAAALIEKARADAETHRHGVEQSLITRAAELDQEAARRQVELKEREQEILDQLASARNEAEHVLAAAQREAKQQRQDAEAKASELLERVEQTANRQREAAEHELRRLRALQSGARTEIARLHKMLAGELEQTPEPPDGAAPQAAGPRPSGPPKPTAGPAAQRSANKP